MITAYRDNPRPALQPPPRVSWWRRFFLGWLDARRGRQRAEDEHKRHLEALRRDSAAAWSRYYVRSSYTTDETIAARRDWLWTAEAVRRTEARATP